ncbi:MAG: dephospho-CoA kinase [Chitinophagaceae bacterium]
MALRIGLTGGIGSGKTTVAKIFEVLGIPVYYADAEAKRFMNDDPGLKAQLILLFGEEAYVNGQLNRSYVSSIVFNDKEKLALLNAVVHPLTIKDSERWMQLQETPYAIREAALIFESGVNRHLDYVIGVSAPADLRIQRVTARDNISADEVRRRMLNQLDENEKMRLCDIIIVNDEQQLVMPQLLTIHEKILQLASGK